MRPMGDVTEILKQRVSPGVLIFDMEGGLLYSNPETLALLNGLSENHPDNETHPDTIPEEITLLCQEAKARHKVSTGRGGGEPQAILARGAGHMFTLRALLIGSQGEEMSPTHIMVLVEKFVEKRALNFSKATEDYMLSRRELDVLKLICQGLTNRDISEKIFISEYTVKGHIKKIMQKMEVGSRSEIIVALR